jgi:hypothetical protein
LTYFHNTLQWIFLQEYGLISAHRNFSSCPGVNKTGGELARKFKLRDGQNALLNGSSVFPASSQYAVQKQSDLDDLVSATIHIQAA